MKLYDRKIWRETQPVDQGKNKCDLCDREVIKDYIIWEGKHWRVIHNKFPILGIKEHIMAIPIKHIKLSHEIPSEVMSEYPEVLKFIHDFFLGKKYFSFMRESVESRSLEHLHYHFLPGKVGYNDIEYFLKKQGF